MTFDRQSGIFLHLTSLPGPHGIGDLGDGARQFLDFLDRADQSLWQFCPLGPTSATHGHSPYGSDSAFAGNPLLIDLTALADHGWLDESELDGPDAADPHEVRYDQVAPFKRDRLRSAFEGFETTAEDDDREAFAAFREREAAWLDDYVLFTALKTEYDGAWTDWPTDLAGRDSDALAAARESHADECRYHAFVQWVFDRQWQSLRDAATDRGIDLVGDLPIYVAADSADVWASPELFELGDDGRPEVVAGVPPNPGDDGQEWGNPVYDWEYIRDTDYEWWHQRLDRLLSQVDIARIDHFKAFDEYWAIPSDQEPAAGEWRPGPGADFFERMDEKLGGLPFIVEDLGFLDESMVALRDRFGFPGMRIPLYADWCADYHQYKPAAYPENSVGYTSTHDTDTAVGYYRDLGEEQRDCLNYALATDEDSFAWNLIEAVWDSDAVIAMTTVQDLLELGSEARFNTPGTTHGNWAWRVTEDGLDPDIADQLSAITHVSFR